MKHVILPPCRKCGTTCEWMLIYQAPTLDPIPVCGPCLLRILDFDLPQTVQSAAFHYTPPTEAGKREFERLRSERVERNYAS